MSQLLTFNCSPTLCDDFTKCFEKIAKTIADSQTGIRFPNEQWVSAFEYNCNKGMYINDILGDFGPPNPP